MAGKNDFCKVNGNGGYIRYVLTRVRSASDQDYEVGANCDGIEECLISVQAPARCYYRVYIKSPDGPILHLYGITEAEWSPIETVSVVGLLERVEEGIHETHTD